MGSHEVKVSARFFAPPDDLKRYFTSFYLTEIGAPRGALAIDLLHPEWANLRFFEGACPSTGFVGQPRLTGADFVGTGPSSGANHFEIGATRLWGIGILPLGWARFVGVPAAAHANLVADGRTHPAFARFAPLADQLAAANHEPEAELAAIARFFRDLPGLSGTRAAQIQGIHSALVDPATATVRELVDRVGLSQRTVERVCQEAFGFPPKLLLRRQRFMRSLAKFMLDPSLKWIGALDEHYHDQAQFVRDFREFMGMAPGEYAARPRPVLDVFISERMRVAGAAVQTLDRPHGIPAAAE